MARRTALFRMKEARTFGAFFWPWRRVNTKQVQIVAKVHKKNTRSATHQDMRRQKSPFFHHTRAKKLMGLLYGQLHVSYLFRLFAKATSHKGHTIANFFAGLESRLDTVLYRVQFAPSLQAARQLIMHKKICVNNAVCPKPGYILQPGDVIAIVPEAREHVGQTIQHFVKAPNTQKALRTLGLLTKFKPTRRPTRAKKRTKRIHVSQPMHTHQQHTTRKSSTPLPLFMSRQQARKRRVQLRVTTDAQQALLLQRPKTTRTMVRFQRTAHNMPVKQWIHHLCAHLTHTPWVNTLMAHNAWMRKQEEATHTGIPARTKIVQTRKKHQTHPFRFMTKKIFYKPTHVEVNYHTLHIVYVCTPDYAYFPIKLALHHVATAFQH